MVSNSYSIFHIGDSRDVDVDVNIRPPSFTLFPKAINDLGDFLPPSLRVDLLPP